MWEKFGEFDSADEINKAAEGLKTEGDEDSLMALAEENGIDKEDARDYFMGRIESLATVHTAAIGKLDAEAKSLGLPGNILLYDWVNQIKTYLMQDMDIALAVRRKGKSLAGCLAKIMLVAFTNQWNIPNKILKEAKLSANKVTFGVPSAASVNKLIKDYYKAPIEIKEAAGEKK